MGHIVDDCPQHGDEQESSTTKRSMPLAHAFVADVVVDPDNDGGALLHDQHSSLLLGAEEEDTPTSFTALDTTLFVSPTPTSPINNEVYLDSYQTGMIITALSTIANLSPVCLSTLSSLYNTILNSGCTNHIIQDHSLFWTYHTSMAVPVKMANCGILETLAKDDVKFHIQCGSQSIVFVLHDCLHVLSAPINLLSVGTMQEHWMWIHFNEDSTMIHFPSDHPILAGLSVQASVLHHLSFLKCAFLLPTPPISDGTEVAFPTFPVPARTTSLWHLRLCHIGVDATHVVLPKNYATGVDWTGPLDLSE